MSDNAPMGNLPVFIPPVSAFKGPVAELVAQRLLLPPPRPGVLAGLDRFEILRILGSGGMGIVLLARDPDNGREVAIKLVKSELVTDQHVLHRFLKEAGHLKRLQHTNIVPVAEISDRVEGPYFVMPYFEKGSLAARIKPGKPLDDESILDLAAQVAEGLSFAHRSGIIHRDLKPANILLSTNGRVCLADFGLARTMFNDTIVDVESRQLEGTAPYMSPAVAAGDAEDTRCDIYSFGAVLYEMLTGYPPYTGRGTKEILDQIIVGPPKPILSLNAAADRGLVTVAEGAMARELRDRYADMRDILTDLQRIKANQRPIGQRKTKSVGSTPKMVGALAVLAVAGLAAWFAWHEHSPAAPASVLAPAPGAPVTPAAPPATTPTPVATVPPSTLTPTPVVTSTPVATTPTPTGMPVPPPAPVPPPVAAPVFKPSVRVFAGQTGMAGSADGAGSGAQFRLPNAVAVDKNGNLYVADTGNNLIRKISPDGSVRTLAGVLGGHGTMDGPAGTARFWAPFGIAVDAPGNVYVADTANNIIRKITADGTVSTLAGLAGHPGSQDGAGYSARFRNPWGIAVDGSGNVYVADMSNDAIRKITPAGVVSTLAGQAGISGTDDGLGDSARFNNPFALTVDPDGNVYVSDSANNAIRKITPDGGVTTVAGLPGFAGSADGDNDNARFWNPQGLAVDKAGNIYIADTGNNIIRKMTPAGIVTTLTGLAGTSGITDGSLSDARFNSPDGVAVDAAGNLYVADTSNHTIRKITLQQ